MFGLMNDLEDDPIFGHHMRSMRQMNNSLMSSLFADPFGGMFGGGIGSMHHNLESLMGAHQSHMRPSRHNMMMPFGMGMNRLLNTDHMPENGLSYSSSSVYSMSSGPDGVPQVYQASSSMRQGPNGIRETRKTVQDSRTGTKQMAIGHHIGDRAHIIEKQQNMRTGTMEENQEFINLEDTEAEDFDREFQQKARSVMGPSGGGVRRLERPEMLALPAPPSSSTNEDTSSQPSPENRRSTIAPRRALHRTPHRTPLAGSSTALDGDVTTSVHPHHHPYAMASRKSRALKGPYNNQH